MTLTGSACRPGPGVVAAIDGGVWDFWMMAKHKVSNDDVVRRSHTMERK
jgi:hypothetical protein